MGIEGFFNSLKTDYSIVKDIFPNTKIKYDIDSLFFDFNSIIHVVSYRVINFIYNLMLSYLNKKDTSQQIINIIDSENTLLNDFKISSKVSDNNIIIYFNEYFNENKIVKIIIKNLKLYLKQLINNHFSNLQLIYISIDGVPSKAKIVEQKKRRYISIFVENVHKIILNKHKEYLKKNNNYNKIKHKVSWNKSINISPASSFMIKLDEELELFKIELKKMFKCNVIISGFNEEGEGETKIMRYINNNEIGSKICIYSPDADLILLTLIIKNNNIKQSYVLRNDQQKSNKIVKNIIDCVDSMINITRLKNIILLQFDKKLNKTNIINDIIFIFTFFGDDFLHKLESINVKEDIKFLTEKYSSFILSKKYILYQDKGLFKINLENFAAFLKELIPYEDYFLKRNHLLKKYMNVRKEFKKHSPKKKDHSIFDYIINNKQLIKWSKTIDDRYHQSKVDNTNKYEIEKYQFNNMLDTFYEKLNNKDNINLGEFYNNKNISNKIFIESKKKFYDKYFKDLKLATKNYIMGLIWIVDYYFNDITYNIWYYPFEKSPLLSDIYNGLTNLNNFDNLRNELKIKYISKYNLSPLEQLLYIIPFDKDLKLIDNIFYSYPFKDKIKQIINKLIDDDKYPNIKKISHDIYTSDKNNLIDCTGVNFMSKCILKIVHNTNKINIDEFITFVRKYLPLQNQKIFNKGGFLKKYKKYKSLFFYTGKIKYKRKYNKYKYLLKY